ncbi:hypothetical protein DV736_g1167, partial [Chaetothyriales sp. CBS 134916]
MNGLVSYESSSDEDDAATTTTQDNAGAHTNTPTPVAGQALAPMVGPSLPTSLEPDEGSFTLGDRLVTELAADAVLASLSEQDLLRHLTQASHPINALPPSPPGSPDPTVEARFVKFLELKKKGLHFNADLAKKPSFRNPALLKTLMARAGIDDQICYASSLPTDIWDPAAFPPHAYKEELARSQQSIRDRERERKRHESAAGTRRIDFHSSSTPSSQHSTPASLPKQANV